jgi:hypothetical protein
VILEGSTYPATIDGFKEIQTGFGPRVAWIFQPNDFPEARPAGFTSMSDGRNAKGMEWARRVLGKSTATDMKWGRDLKEKRPLVDWGPEELNGKPCRIVVEKTYSEELDEYRNTVVNVLPPDETNAEETAAAEEEDFADIPF